MKFNQEKENVKRHRYYEIMVMYLQPVMIPTYVYVRTFFILTIIQELN